MLDVSDVLADDVEWSVERLARDLFRYLLVSGYLFSMSSVLCSADPVRLLDRPVVGVE